MSALMCWEGAVVFFLAFGSSWAWGLAEEERELHRATVLGVLHAGNDAALEDIAKTSLVLLRVS